MSYIAYYLDNEADVHGQVVLMNSFEKEEDAYYCLGEYIFRSEASLPFVLIHDDLICNSGKRWSTICMENIEDFDIRFKKYKDFPLFCSEFRNEFTRCIPIIKEAVKENMEDCNNYTNFGVHKN